MADVVFLFDNHSLVYRDCAAEIRVYDPYMAALWMTVVTTDASPGEVSVLTEFSTAKN